MEIVQSYLTKNPYYQNNVNRIDGRYTTFQDRGPLGLMLHSVGCAQPSAQVFIKNWNKESYTNACVHGFIDANDGKVYQTLPWNYRGAHAGKAAGNNTLVGVEMCESSAIRYRKDDLTKFDVLDQAKAEAHCRATYKTAVELFAELCRKFGFDPENAILSHKEGGVQGVASKHGDPEHYWLGLGMPYTMRGFREDVKKLLTAAQPAVEDGVMYRIQLGAFRRKDYAEAYLEQVKKTFPEAYLVKGVG